VKNLFLASSVETTGPAIGKEIENILGKKAKDIKLVFIPTAGMVEEEKGWIENDRSGLVEAGFEINDYDITDKTPKDIEKDLNMYDVIHVNGGDTFYLLIQARKSGFDKWIKEKVLSGEKIYTGSSAGSIACAPNTMDAEFFENYDYFKELKTYEGFGLVDFMIFPHWGSEDFKEKFLNHRIEVAYKADNKIILLNDWQYMKVEGDKYRIVDVRDK